MTDEQIHEATSDAVNQITADLSTFSSARLFPESSNKVIRLAIELWPAIVPIRKPLVGKRAHRMTERSFAQRVREEYEKRYGMGFILSIVLAAIITEVIKRLINRWWENRGEFRRNLRTAQSVMRGSQP